MNWETPTAVELSSDHPMLHRCLQALENEDPVARKARQAAYVRGWCAGQLKPRAKHAMNAEELTARRRKYYVQNQDTEKAVALSRWNKKSWEQRMLLHAKRRGAVGLNLSDIPTVGSTCPICERPFDASQMGTTPSIDRVDPVIGYVAGNLCAICHDCNRQKSDMTITDLERIIAYIRERTQ